MHKFSTLLLIATLLGVAVADTITSATVTGIPSRQYPIVLPRADGKIYYGYGFISPTTYPTDAFLYDPATGTSTAATQTNGPTGRYANIVCTSPDKTKAFVGFGATSGGRVLEFFILDLNTLTWTKQENTTALPFKTRNLGPSIWLPSGQVLVFGGKDGNNFYNDLLSYDVATNNWTVVIPDKTAGSPPGRSGTVSTHNSDYTKWYIYGGMVASSPSTVVTGDLIILDLKNLTWVSQKSLSDVPARYTQAAALVQNTWFIIGGANSSSTFLNSFTIDLETETVSNASRAVLPTSTGSAYTYVKDDSTILLFGGSTVAADTVLTYSIDPAVPLAPSETTYTSATTDTTDTDSTTSDTNSTDTDSTDTNSTDTNTTDTNNTDNTDTNTNSNTNTGSSTSSEDNGVSVIAPCVAVMVAAFALLF